MTSNKIRAKCIKENKYGFIVGEVYDGYRIVSAYQHKDSVISVIDRFGEEYAYPLEFFEVVEE